MANNNKNENQQSQNVIAEQPQAQDRVEWTTGGFNYGLDKAVSQSDNQQGHYNALVGSGHVVGMPIQPEVDTPEKQGQVMPTRESRLGELKQPVETNTQPATPTPVKQKTTTKQPTVSQQDTPVQEPVVNPDEFGYLNKPETPEQAEEKIEANEEAIANMESDLNQSTAGRLYGKVTADQSTSIRTLEDENSIYRARNEGRIQAFKDMQTMSSDSIAAAVVSGTIAADTQVMRDLMQYDPAKYNEIQNQIKAIRGQMNINAITSGSGDYNTIATNGQSGINNDIANFATNNSNGIASSADILKSVNNTLNSNVAAASAQEQMGTIENDMINLQNRLKNLKKEASTVFKGDVPQYIVNAYVANRTAEIQDQLGMLEQRYNAAYSRYQTEWERTKWEAEYDLKKQELQLKKESALYNNWATEQGILQGWAKIGGTANNVQTTTLTREEISMNIDTLVDMCKNGQLGNAQCAAGLQKYYLPTLGVNLGTLSKWSEKQGICNELAGSYTPQKGDIVVMSSSSKPENGHMGAVIAVNGNDITYLDRNGSVENGVGTEKPEIRTMKLTDSKIYGYYNPTKPSPMMFNPDTLEWHGETYNLSDYPRWDNLSDAAKETVRGLLTYQIDPDSLPKTGENGVIKTEVLAAAANIGREAGWTDKKAKSAAKFIDTWNKGLNQGGVGSANSTAASLLREMYNQFDDFNEFDIQSVNNWLNRMSVEFGGSGVMATYADLNVAANEVAKALKGNASATEQEKKDIQSLLTGKMSNAQAKEVFKHFAKDLVDKNASEAQQYERVVGYKPEPIYLEEVSDWMNNELGVDMSRYYDYTPSYGDLQVFVDKGNKGKRLGNTRYTSANILGA